MGAVVVQDEMNIQGVGHPGVDRVKELAELDGTVTLVELADDFAALRVEGRKESGRAVACVVVIPPLGLAGPHRKQRLGAIQRLDLGFLVNAENQGLVGWVQIEPNDVANLLDEEG